MIVSDEHLNAVLTFQLPEFFAKPSSYSAKDEKMRHERKATGDPRVPLVGASRKEAEGARMEKLMTRRRPWTIRAVLAPLFLNLTLFVAVASGQATTASITGTVTDETKGNIPGVSVTAKNLETGISRTVVTDGRGEYQIRSLPLGEYEVQAELSGFRPALQRGIRLTTGRQAELNLVLAVGGLTEEVVVQGDAPIVDTSSGALGQVVQQEEVASMPVQGRNIARFVTTAPGVTQVRTARESERKISAVGARPTMNLFLLDGVNIQGYDNNVPTGASGNMLGLEGVREIKVSTNAYSAEFGRAGGAIIQVSTKSGTNQFRGSSYWYHRNEAMEAENFFTPPGTELPDFSRHQYGGSLGGPILRNRTFFFSSYERLRDRVGTSGIRGTLTADAREGRVGNRVIEIHPSVRPFLAHYPLPNGPILDHGDGTGDFSFGYARPTDEHHVQARIDHQFSAADSLFGRYTFLDSVRANPGTAPEFGTMGDETGARNHYVTVEYQRVVTPEFLNSLRVGYSRDDPFERLMFGDSTIPHGLFLVPAQTLLPGEISVRGLGTLGQAVQGESRTVSRYQLMQNGTIDTGKHTVRFGASVERMVFNGFNPGRDGGLYQFGSLLDFLQDARPNRFRGTIRPGQNDAVRNITQTHVGMYIQDDYRLSRRFTLNAGLRWEFTTVPSEKDGKTANFRGDLAFLHQATLEDLSIGDPWFQLPKTNFEPRLGFAWDVAGDGKTSVRGGGGLFHNQIDVWLYRTAAFRSPPFLVEVETRARNMPFPNMFDLCAANAPQCIARSTVDHPGWDMETPRIAQFNLSIDREVLPLTMVGVAYAGSRGTNLGTFADKNSPRAELIDGRLVYPEHLTGRPNPNFDYMRNRYSATRSWYDSLEVRASRRYHAGLHFRAAYTWSKFLDEQPGSQSASDTNVGGGDIYFYDPSFSKGPTNFDVRHAFTLNGAYELPFGSERRWGADWGPIARGLLGGWQVSGLWTVTSGAHGSVTVGNRLGFLGVGISPADLIPGGNPNPVLGGHEQYFDPSQFAMPPARTLGNVGRGTLEGPGLNTLDLALAKAFPLTRLSDRSRLEFRLEAFNALNTVNLGFPELEVFDRRGRPNPTAGRITETSTDARQLQVSLRVEW